MNKEQIEEIKCKIEKVVSILERNAEVDAHECIFASDTMEGAPIRIRTYEEMEAFEAPIKHILSDKSISKKYSENFVRNNVIDTYRSLLQDSSNIYDVAKELISSLIRGESKKYWVVSEVENIRISDDDSYRVVDSTIKILKKEDLPFEEELFIKDMEEDGFINTPSIFTEVTAGDSKKAEEMALYNFTTSLNLLKLYFPIFNPVLSGQLTHRTRSLKAYNIDDSTLHTDLSRIDDFHPDFIYINKIVYNELKQQGIENLQKNNSLKEVIKGGLYWYGFALKEKHPSARLLMVVTVLETILKRDGERTELRRAIAERAALFLGSNFKHRKKILQDLKDIYDIRSNVVHRGTLINDQDIVELAEEYARKVLIKLIKSMDKFNGNFEEFIDYLDDLKLKAKDELIEFGDD